MNPGSSRMRMIVSALSVLLVLMAGCASSPPTRFYTLTPLLQPSPESHPAGGRKIAVNISPVEIPDVLNRFQIVTRDGQNELKLAEFDRWAGSLSESMGVVLGENLSLLLGTDRVFAYPRVQSTAPDFTVAVRILHLDCIPGQRVQLKAQWTVLAGADRREILTRISVYTAKPDNSSFAALVTNVSQTLAELSAEIALTIQAQSPRQP